ncbi:MAG: hypothetical protein C4539_16105 [Ignavibacteriales bacterium]|nr:MAG: hypothetical protein C4539_16105 [Ignavibacteriales bacterium]
MIMKSGKLFLLFIFVTALQIFAQEKSKNQDVFIDMSGVMRWKGSNEEVALFGVNYTVPFAYSYRAHKKLNLSLKQAIDLDVSHMVRLGLNAFRVHVWDREISDRDGNLLENEHLELLDYLLSKLSESGIKIILTPIAWWGTGWPEPDPETPGFSQKYSKIELVTNSLAKEAERNYLKQFLNHRNKFSKHLYKDDPDIIAMEIINEPFHPKDTSGVTEYINEMYDVMRNAGFNKPIFYNISENWNDEQANAVTKSKAEGITFQWYPTGLVHNKMLKGNYLVNVNEYKIPSENVREFNKKTKLVYEFDAADVGGSFMYPAMARSYREAGMQFAAMFSYDPVQIAWSNTEYPTHYLNLLYTPSKAISLMIAGKVFNKIERNKSYGSYPANNVFDNFHVSYAEDLSEMNSGDEFYYSNSTNTIPADVKQLKHVAGVGNSPIVKYDGTGSYFLDKQDDGIWRLEVYPDACWIRDPFASVSLEREVSKLFWNEKQMKIDLPDLGNNYKVITINSGNQFKPVTLQNDIKIKPGIYLLVNNKVEAKAVKKYTHKKEKFLDGLYLPKNLNEEINVVNNSKEFLIEDSPLNLEFQIATDKKIKDAYLFIRRLNWRGFEKHKLEKADGFKYILNKQSGIVSSGKLEYCITIDDGNDFITFPGGIKSSPDNWDFPKEQFWTIDVLSKESPVKLFDPVRDRKDLIFPFYSENLKYNIEYKHSTELMNDILQADIKFSENQTTPFAIQNNLSKLENAIKYSNGVYKNIIINCRSVNNSTAALKINLVTSDADCYSYEVRLSDSWQKIVIPIEKFIPSEALILPNSYPKFLPKTWDKKNVARDVKDSLNKLEFIQIVCDKENSNNSVFEIESVYLSK